MSEQELKDGGIQDIDRTLVLIEWEDSVQPYSDWKFLDDTPKLRVAAVQSVGWCVGNNETTVMLAPNVGDLFEDDEQGSGFINIPKRAITKITVLVPHETVVLKS